MIKEGDSALEQAGMEACPAGEEQPRVTHMEEQSEGNMQMVVASDMSMAKRRETPSRRSIQLIGIREGIEPEAGERQ